MVRADDGRTAVLLGPDEDGDYGWSCEACGAGHGDHGFQPIEDTIANAEVHLDHRCEQRST